MDAGTAEADAVGGTPVSFYRSSRGVIGRQRRLDRERERYSENMELENWGVSASRVVSFFLLER
jgi:hypothetical protein